MSSRTALLAAAAVTLALGACGSDDKASSGSAAKDKAAVRKIAQDGIDNPKTLCDNFEPSLLKSYGGLETCRKGASNPKSVTDAKVTEVTVDGDKATAIIVASAGKLTTDMKRLDGRWVITAQR